MARRPIAPLMAGLVIASLATSPGQAAERKMFEQVKGWEVERVVGDKSSHPCQISKSYKDENDKNAENAIVLAFGDDGFALSLGYQNWTWDKDETVKATLLINGKVVSSKSPWIGDGAILVTKLPNDVLPKLVAAKKIVLRFKDGDADFDIFGLPQALEAMERCERAGAPAAQAAAPAPAMPSQGHIKAYAFGLMTQEILKECDIKTTGAQRIAVDAKVASLQPEMAPVDAPLRESLKGRTERCPPAADAATFENNLASFIAMPVDDFVAMMDRKEAEKKAAPKL